MNRLKMCATNQSNDLRTPQNKGKKRKIDISTKSISAATHHQYQGIDNTITIKQTIGPPLSRKRLTVAPDPSIAAAAGNGGGSNKK
jgi:hypothetical protein